MSLLRSSFFFLCFVPRQAEMENDCSLATWKTNSRIIRATSQTPDGPYAYAQTIRAPFAHNPTIRRAPDGTYLLYHIGGWPTVPSNCSSMSDTPKHPVPMKHDKRIYTEDDALQSKKRFMYSLSTDSCVTTATLDPKGMVRVGSDYAWINMSATAVVSDCVDACCSDPACMSFSFNNPQPSADHDCPSGGVCCLLKSSVPPLQPSTCSCQTGFVERKHPNPFLSLFPLSKSSMHKLPSEPLTHSLTDSLTH